MTKKRQPVEGERLQKALANEGLGSRRQIEQWIVAQRIKVNGKPAQLGDRYRRGDKLHIDGRPVNIKGVTLPLIAGLMYYKPEGEIITRADEKNRKTVFDSLPACEHGRWISVGRLDINSSGLLLLTNYGELAHRLMRPQYRILREYAVRVLGEISAQQIQQLLDGVELEDGMAKFETVSDAGGKGKNHWYHVSLREGRNREVRRLWEACNARVSRLIRIRYGAIKLDSKLKTGEYRPLTFGELNQLLNETGLPTLTRGATHKPRAATGDKPTRKQRPTKKRGRRQAPPH